MKMYAERESSKLILIQQTKNVSTSYILKQCHIHIVFVQLYVELSNDFNVFLKFS